MSDAARFLVGAELRRRWRTYVAVAVVVLISGSVALASLAGARRTATAFDRYLADSDASELAINIPTDDPATQRALADLPGVERVSTYAGGLFAPFDPEREELLVSATLFEGIISVDGRFLEQDRAAVEEGHLPDPERVDEVMINRALADASGFGVGDRLPIVVLSPTTYEPIGDDEVTVTAIGVTAEDVAIADVDALQRMVVTPAFLAAHPDMVGSGEFDFTYWWAGLELEPGVDPADVEAAWEAHGDTFSDETTFRYRRTDTIRESVALATRPHVVALGAFGAVATALALVLTGLAVRRSVRSGASSAAVLRAIGADPVTATIGPTVAATAAVVVGALGAGVAAVLLSPLAPIGPTRVVDPNDGISVDLLVLAVGVVLLSLAGVLSAVVVARRVRRGSEPDLGVTPSYSLPVVAAVGLQFALSRRSAAARTAVVGAVLATVAVVATLAFGASLRHLEVTPRLYGDDFDAALQVGAGYSEFDGSAFDRFIEAEHTDLVSAWAPVTYEVLTLGDAAVPVLGVDEGSGGIGPAMVSGRAPVGLDEVVLGADTASANDLEVGDDVDVEGQTFVVVGTAVLPALGQATGDHPGLGTGAWMTGDALRAVGASGDEELGASAVLLRTTPGADLDGLVKSMEADPRGWGLSENDIEESGVDGIVQVMPSPRPAELVGTSGSGRTSIVFGGVLYAGALVALALALAASVRLRRRDLAVLRAVGCTQRQLVGMIETQALVTMLIGAAVGVPLGLALGSTLWRLFARDLGVLDEVVVPLGLITAAGAVGTVLAMFLAARPGWSAARSAPAVVLRSE